MDNQDFAKILKKIRGLLSLKQLSLSSALGCTSSAVSFWENGRRLPDEVTLRRISGVLSNLGAAERDLLEMRQAWLASALAKAGLDVASKDIRRA
jgi:transcriptional regulator with XRE-family HTH domain